MAETHKHWLEIAPEYAKDLSTSARTILGLSTASIGAMLTAARDFEGTWKLPILSTSLAFFLGSITAWLLFAANLTAFRQAIGRSILATGYPEEAGAADEPLRQTEISMLTWASAQRVLFVIGAWFAACGFLLVHAMK